VKLKSCTNYAHNASYHASLHIIMYLHSYHILKSEKQNNDNSEGAVFWEWQITGKWHISVQVYRPTQYMYILLYKVSLGGKALQSTLVMLMRVQLWNFSSLSARLAIALPTAHLLYKCMWSTETHAIGWTDAFRKSDHIQALQNDSKKSKFNLWNN
jgi:hypothetical protein